MTNHYWNFDEKMRIIPNIQDFYLILIKVQILIWIGLGFRNVKSEHSDPYRGDVVVETVMVPPTGIIRPKDYLTHHRLPNLK